MFSLKKHKIVENSGELLTKRQNLNDRKSSAFESKTKIDVSDDQIADHIAIIGSGDKWSEENESVDESLIFEANDNILACYKTDNISEINPEIFSGIVFPSNVLNRPDVIIRIAIIPYNLISILVDFEEIFHWPSEVPMQATITVSSCPFTGKRQDYSIPENADIVEYESFSNIQNEMKHLLGLVVRQNRDFQDTLIVNNHPCNSTEQHNIGIILLGGKRIFNSVMVHEANFYLWNRYLAPNPVSDIQMLSAIRLIANTENNDINIPDKNEEIRNDFKLYNDFIPVYTIRFTNGLVRYISNVANMIKIYETDIVYHFIGFT